MYSHQMIFFRIWNYYLPLYHSYILANQISRMASSKIPLSVRITDAVHRTTVLGLVGICIVGIGSITYNVYRNSDFAKMNENKLTFNKEQYHEARKEEDN